MIVNRFSHAEYALFFAAIANIARIAYLTIETEGSGSALDEETENLNLTGFTKCSVL
jgi:hypothetical protein